MSRMEKSLTLRGEFVTLTKQVVNPKKTRLWATEPELRKKLAKLRFKGEQLTVANAARQ